MSACRAGCDSVTENHLCDVCMRLWLDSAELKRCTEMAMDDRVSVSEHEMRSDIAFVDFCTRVRLEHQNRRPDETA